MFKEKGFSHNEQENWVSALFLVKCITCLFDRG